eukprot:5095950-Heterocapsa_arctica.AAC.1
MKAIWRPLIILPVRAKSHSFSITFVASELGPAFTTFPRDVESLRSKDWKRSPPESERVSKVMPGP